MKNKRLEIRLTEQEKADIIKLSKERGLSVTDLILTDLFNKKDKVREKAKMNYINVEHFDYSKISTNINQVAKYVNTNQNIDENTLKEFNILLRELIILKNKANDIAYKYIMEI